MYLSIIILVNITGVIIIIIKLIYYQKAVIKEKTAYHKP